MREIGLNLKIFLGVAKSQQGKAEMEDVGLSS